MRVTLSRLALVGEAVLLFAHYDYQPKNGIIYAVFTKEDTRQAECPKWGRYRPRTDWTHPATHEGRCTIPPLTV